MKLRLELGQVKFYKVWNKKKGGKKRKTGIKRNRVFQIVLNVGRMEILLFNGILIIQCFCHGEGNIQLTLINHNDAIKIIQ